MSCMTTINSTPIPSVAATSVQPNMTSGGSTIVTGSVALPVTSPANSASTSSANNAATFVSQQNPAGSGINVPTDNAHLYQVLTRQRLQELVREVDPNVQPDEEVEELLLNIASSFIEEVVETSCMLAKHRKSAILEVKDVQLSLEKNWNMFIPGFGCEEVRPYKKSATTEAHKQRMALIRKTLKK